MQDSIDIQLQEQGIPFGKYSLVAKLAVGGMAELFVARQKGLAGFTKTVAVKCILPYFARDREFISMFLGEARLAAHLNHPNVVQIQDVGDVDGVYYMVMEYIPGQNLKSLAKRLYTIESYRDDPPYALIASLFVQALQGLNHVHNATDENQEHLHLVHRDISPNNLMLSYDGNVKIVDFGVAKAKTQESETQVGVLKGRLSYMSPEHLSGQPLDGRSDIFAMGVVLYELTTNRRLFKRRSEAETMQALMTSPIPPPSRIYPDYPPGLELLLMKALNRDPNKRFQTAEEMRNALEDWLIGFDQSALGTRHLVAIMEELFPEEKQNERQGIYPKPVTHNDLMNLARGSYRVMEDGSIYTYFAAPGSQGAESSPPSGGTAQAAQMMPLVHGSQGSLAAQGTNSGTHDLAGAQQSLRTTSPYAPASADVATAQHRAVSSEYPSPDDDEPTTPGQSATLDDSADTAQAPEVDVHGRGTALRTASYSLSESAKESLERGEMPQHPQMSTSPVKTSPIPAHPGLVIEADLDDEEDIGTDVGLAAAPDDDEPPTALQPLPAGSGDFVATSASVVDPGPPIHVAVSSDSYDEDEGSRKGLFIVVLLVLLLGGGAAWWFLMGPGSGDGLSAGTAEVDAGVAATGQGSADAGATTAPDTDASQSTAPIVPRAVDAGGAPERAAVPFVMRKAPVRPAVRIPIRRRVVRRRPVRRRTYRRRLPTTAKMPFSSVRLERKVRLPVYARRGGRRAYTSAHPRLCRKIEREVGRVFGRTNAVRGITRSWQRYVRKRFAKSRRYSFVFYPRAAAYVIFRDLRRGKSFRYISQNLVKYQKSYRFSRYRNK